MAQIEDIVLLHSKRGMTILKEHCPDDFCRQAAQLILDTARGNVLITTGFYVVGSGETDGPPGAAFLAKALEAVGYHPVIVTDDFCRGFFECENIDTVYAATEMGEADYAAMLDTYTPTLLLSIERCGRNINGDYANMRGISIADHNSKVDYLFELGAARGIPSIGIGDGGNEIGMGNFKEIISSQLSLVPCEVEVTKPVIATVSNWGGYGICAYLEKMTGKHVLPSYAEELEYLDKIVALGSVDGVTKEHVHTVDSYPEEVEAEILAKLHDAIK